MKLNQIPVPQVTEHALNFVFHAYVSGQIPALQGTGSGVASFGDGHLESARVWFSLRPKQTTLMGKRPVKKKRKREKRCWF